MFSRSPTPRRRISVWLARYLFLLSALNAAPLLAEEASRPRLLATVKPLQLIAQAVVGNQAEVDLLIAPGQSHHDYHLRPSDRARLARAELVIWVGPGLESYLNRTMASLPATQVLTLAPELQHSAAHQHGHDDVDDTRGIGDADGHIWLDPKRAVAIAHRIADEMGEREPSLRSRWEGNAERFAREMAILEQRFRDAFAALERPRGYLVMHDAYGHFERHFGLRRTGTYSATPEQQPGVRHFSQLARALDKGKIGCVFTEPQYRAVALERLTSDHPGIRVTELDLMADRSESGEAGFARFFAQFAEAFLSCVGP